MDRRRRRCVSELVGVVVQDRIGVVVVVLGVPVVLVLVPVLVVWQGEARFR